MEILNCIIVKTARQRELKLNENAFYAYPNILVISEKLNLNAFLSNAFPTRRRSVLNTR